MKSKCSTHAEQPIENPQRPPKQLQMLQLLAEVDPDLLLARVLVHGTIEKGLRYHIRKLAPTRQPCLSTKLE